MDSRKHIEATIAINATCFSYERRFVSGENSVSITYAISLFLNRNRSKQSRVPRFSTIFISRVSFRSVLSKMGT